MKSDVLLRLTAQIATSYISHNKVPASDLPLLIASVRAALHELDYSAQKVPPRVPAVPISKSITPTAIISLEDGKPYKTLKRHLKVAYGMTPDEYRTKWGLPADYPMVAPNYAERRAAIAKSQRLGRSLGFSYTAWAASNAAPKS